MTLNTCIFSVQDNTGPYIAYFDVIITTNSENKQNISLESEKKGKRNRRLDYLQAPSSHFSTGIPRKESLLYKAI